MFWTLKEEFMFLPLLFLLKLTYSRGLANQFAYKSKRLVTETQMKPRYNKISLH